MDEFLDPGIFYSTLFPLWEGYDEFSHFAYVQHLVSPGGLPVVGRSQVSQEIEESVRLTPLPWLLRDLPAPSVTHDAFWKLPAEEREAREQQLRTLPADWARLPSGDISLFWEALQPPLYYWLLSGPLRLAQNSSLLTRVILLRWLSIAIASLVIPLGFVAARHAFRNDGVALGIVALIAAMPELMVDVSRVGNESLGIVLYTALLYSTLKLLDHPGSVLDTLLVGASLGLGLLTKAYFLTAGPALALIFAWAAWRRKRFNARILLHGILGASTALLISGWWYLRNYRMLGALFWQPGAEAIRGQSLVSLLRQISEVDWHNVLRSLVISHIWFGGWSFLQVRGWMYKFFEAIIVLAVAGLAIHTWRLVARAGAHASLVPRPGHLFVLISFYSFFCLGLAYDALLMFVLHHVSAAQGWYLYCPVMAEVGLAASGLLALLPGRGWRWILPAVTACFTLLELYATHFILVPYYAGLIAHNSTGTLGAFHPGIPTEYGVRTVVTRLLLDKPLWLTAPVFVAFWVLFLASTIALPVLSSRMRRPSCPGAAG